MAISRGDLSGTKNGSNTSFTFPVTPIANSELIIFNTSALKIVDQTEWDASSATQKLVRALVVGTAVTLGVAPAATDDLWYECDT